MVAKQGSQYTRAMSKEEILRITSTLPYRTSCHLNWCGVEVHRYRFTYTHEVPPQEHTHSQLVVHIHHNESPVRTELYTAGKTFAAQFQNGCVSIEPPGLLVSARFDNVRPVTNEATVIFIDPFVLAEIGRTKNGVGNLDILPQVNIRDSLIWEIASAMENALVSVPPVPAIYAESLAATLAAHILVNYTKPSSSHVRSAKLNKAQLQRSIEFIHENLHRNLTLEEIAAVANMSKYHFAKSFRQAMGMAPHHYLVDLRVAKARKLLTLEKSMTLAEVANVVGYSDKSHFIAQFFKVVGTTPHKYRQQV